MDLIRPSRLRLRPPARPPGERARPPPRPASLRAPRSAGARAASGAAGGATSIRCPSRALRAPSSSAQNPLFRRAANGRAPCGRGRRARAEDRVGRRDDDAGRPRRCGEGCGCARARPPAGEGASEGGRGSTASGAPPRRRVGRTDGRTALGLASASASAAASSSAAAAAAATARGRAAVLSPPPASRVCAQRAAQRRAAEGLRKGGHGRRSQLGLAPHRPRPAQVAAALSAACARHPSRAPASLLLPRILLLHQRHARTVRTKRGAGSTGLLRRAAAH
eukprot:scaffold1402_cov403-Prasinococcus_capsulatus_cf.AAC.4